MSVLRLAVDRHARHDQRHAEASWSDGTWASTTMPITVAVAGNWETISAYLDRARRHIANCSLTYGITNDEIPTPASPVPRLSAESHGAR